LQKTVFLRKNLWELLDAGVLHIFEISSKFRFFWNPLRKIMKKFFFNSYKGAWYFFGSWKVKKARNRSILKKTLFYSLRILRPNQNHMKQSDLGKSQDPTGEAKLWGYRT
jgi:hypothetical protein